MRIEVQPEKLTGQCEHDIGADFDVETRNEVVYI